MKAIYYEKYGPRDVLKYGEIQDPVPGPGEVLVEVKAASINAVDWKIQFGDLKIMSGSNFPKIPGTDFAGRIKVLGPGVTGWEVADPVYGVAHSYGRKPGTLAELVAVPASALRKLPNFMDYTTAASLPVAALTASNGFRPIGSLGGKSVAVVGATGGVGHFAVQFAKMKGAQVTGIARTANLELARQLGADEVVDYTKQDFTQLGRKYDVIFDTHPHLGFYHFKPALTRHGWYLTPLPAPAIFLHAFLSKVFGGVQVAIANLRVLQDDYAEMENAVQTGKIKPYLEQKFPLQAGARAMAAASAGNVRGKIVVEI